MEADSSQRVDSKQAELLSWRLHAPVMNDPEHSGMHVTTHTSLRPEQLDSVFRSLGSGIAGDVSFDAERAPPKFFLKHLPVTMAPSAELDVQRQSAGSTVVLRLMWGALPAPFPRALFGVGLLGAIGLLSTGSTGFLTLLRAGLLAGLPTLALVYQKRGEARLQTTLANLIGSKGFIHQAH